MEDVMMNFSWPSPTAKSQIKVPSLNATTWLTSLALLIIVAFAIYMASRTPGTALDELAVLAAFP